MKPETKQILDRQRQLEEIRRTEQLKIEQQRLIQSDFDGDGVSNAEEWANGTNPYSKDTDGDSYTDLQELQSWSNPTQDYIEDEDEELDREREYR